MRARPIAWSIALACVLAVVVFRPRLSLWHIAACVLLTVLWTNVHGSFPLALVLAAAAAFDAPLRRGHLFALGGGVLGTFVNPYGLRLHGLVIEYALGSNGIRAVHERVLEYAPIWRAAYHDVVSPGELGVILVLLVVAIDALRRPHARAAAAVALLLCVGALVQARNAGLAIVLGSLLVQTHVAKYVVARLGTAPELHERAWRWIGPAALAGVLALASTIATRAPDDWIAEAIGGPAFARLARQLPDGAKAFVPFRSGGLLLYVAGERRVTTFYDSRNDCYPAAIARTALALKDGELPEEGLSALLVRHGTSFALVPQEAFVRATPGDPRWGNLAVLEPALRGWTPVAADGGWTLYSAPR